MISLELKLSFSILRAGNAETMPRELRRLLAGGNVSDNFILSTKCNRMFNRKC